jgi:hypothetical protein
MYRLMGLAHAGLYRTYRSLAVERGQGTVEYVALVLLIAAIFAVVVAAGKDTKGSDIANKITGKIQEAITNMGGK